MSLGRIGSRAVVVGLGVLTSLALMAAPSWAAKGGNRANAELCEKESAALVAQDGSHFKNAGACTSYAAKGGQLAQLEAQLLPEKKCFGVGVPCMNARASGFGLKPSTTVTLIMKISNGEARTEEQVPESGVVNFTLLVTFNCPVSGVSATATGTLASGLPVTAPVVTEPSSC
jgi:hypothetical protein